MRELSDYLDDLSLEDLLALKTYYSMKSTKSANMPPPPGFAEIPISGNTGNVPIVTRSNSGMSTMDLMSTLGYQYVKKLGQGAFGVVSLYSVGPNTPTSEKVAIKFLSKRRYKNIDQIHALTREINLLERSSSRKTACSEHIVCIHSFVESATDYIIVTEYLNGYDLGQMRFENLKLVNIIWILIAIAMGLNEIHAKQIVHRDIKPENIMIHTLSNQTPQIKLIDFGMGCIDSDIVSLTTLQCNKYATCGTPIYMAPEIFTAKQIPVRNVFKTDVFSCGVTFYYMLANRQYLYDGESIDELMIDIQTNHHKDITEELTRIYGHLEHERKVIGDIANLLDSMIATSPSKRPSMKEVVNKLIKIEYTMYEDLGKPNTVNTVNTINIVNTVVDNAVTAAEDESLMKSTSRGSVEWNDNDNDNDDDDNARYVVSPPPSVLQVAQSQPRLNLESNLFTRQPLDRSLIQSVYDQNLGRHRPSLANTMCLERGSTTRATRMTRATTRVV